MSEALIGTCFEGDPSSPSGVRSESASQGLSRGAGETLSRAAGTPAGSEATLPLIEVRRSETDLETLTEGGRQMGGPSGGARDEAEQAGPCRVPLNPRRAVVLKLRVTAAAREEVQGLAASSGMCLEHFNSAALLLGARRLAAGLRECR